VKRPYETRMVDRVVRRGRKKISAILRYIDKRTRGRNVGGEWFKIETSTGAEAAAILMQVYLDTDGEPQCKRVGAKIEDVGTEPRSCLVNTGLLMRRAN